MDIRKALFRVSQSTAILMTLGWIGVVCTTVFLPGGHPPLSAYVGVAVIVASWILGLLGLIAGLVSLSLKIPQRNMAILFLCINAGMLAFSVLVNFM